MAEVLSLFQVCVFCGFHSMFCLETQSFLYIFHNIQISCDLSTALFEQSSSLIWISILFLLCLSHTQSASARYLPLEKTRSISQLQNPGVYDEQNLNRNLISFWRQSRTDTVAVVDGGVGNEWRFSLVSNTIKRPTTTTTSQDHGTTNSGKRHCLVVDYYWWCAA